MKDDVFHKKTRGKRPRGGGVRPLASVLKTLRLLDLLGAESKPMRLVDVAKASGMTRATAHQKLVTLTQAGWIEQTADGAYRLALHAARIGNAALAQASLGERVMPFLEKLVAETGETASLAVFDGLHARIVQRVETGGVLRAELRVGALLDLAHSASGRVLMAFASEPFLDNLRNRGVALPDDKLLRQVRREQFAASSGKSYEGVRAVAAPIFDIGGGCIAALSLVGPLPRFSIERTRAPMRRAADAINAFIRGSAS
jgi:DNA-binding IclR family transcriptional regulator